MQNADVPHFDGIFIGVLPKRRSVIPPENFADSRPNKTPIRAPFFVVATLGTKDTIKLTRQMRTIIM